jgi:hypothetical protein
MMETGVDHNQAYPDRALQCFCLALVGQWLPPPCCPSAVEGAVAARRRQPVLTVAAWQLALACTAALASWGRGLSGGATAALRRPQCERLGPCPHDSRGRSGPWSMGRTRRA